MTIMVSAPDVVKSGIDVERVNNEQSFGFSAMDNVSDNVNLMPDFRDVQRPSLLLKLGGNLIVPIGIAMTVGSYAVGLTSLVTSRPRLGQKMMYSRVAFQGITIAAMFYDQWSDRKKMKDRITYKHEQCVLRDFSVHPPTDL